ISASCSRRADARGAAALRGRDPERHFGPGVRELRIERTIVRLEAPDHSPEASRMVQRKQMAELVYQQVANDRTLEKERARVDADVAVPRAAAPARALKTNLDGLGQSSDRLGFTPDPRLQVRPRLVEQRSEE